MTYILKDINPDEVWNLPAELGTSLLYGCQVIGVTHSARFGHGIVLVTQGSLVEVNFYTHGNRYIFEGVEQTDYRPECSLDLEVFLAGLIAKRPTKKVLLESIQAYLNEGEVSWDLLDND